ncbi:MAG: glycosyltransferase family 2 protein [Candidatus Omnitrophota bacterium]
MDMSPLVSVVLSFRNEEDNIPELIARLQKVFKELDPLRYELIFVNDASTDGSLELLLKHRDEDNNIKIINMSRRFGVAPCVKAGFRYAKGDAVVYMDTDLQDPPELISSLVERWRSGADVVNTTRVKRKGESAFRLLLIKLAYKIIRFLADIDIPENTGDFKLLSRRVVDRLIDLNEYDPFMRGLVRWIGFKQVQVFYERQARFGGDTHFPLWSSSGVILDFIRGITSFSIMPLYFSLLAGLVLIAGSLLHLVYIIVLKVLDMVLPSYAVVLTVNIFLGGVILFAIGILGMYMGKIHFEVKKRPAYIIDNTVGFEENAG